MAGREERDEGGSAERYVVTQLTEEALISTGIRIGTVMKTKYMEPFISRTRPDGLHVIDLNKTLARIEVAARFISRFDPKKVVAYSSREFCKTPVEKFAESTGAVAITGRFMPGTFTNVLFPGHIDAELLIVSDPAADAQAVVEASQVGIAVIAVCDTDNVTSDVDLAIPANNRGRKACAAVYWLLARGVSVNIGALAPDAPMKLAIEDFETKLEGEEVE